MKNIFKAVRADSRLVLTLATALLSTTAFAANEPAAPGELRSYSTIQSIGIEWDMTGDANHNATCTAQFRAQGSVAWKAALPLFRVDYLGWYDGTKANRAYNMVAGSIMFLQPGTAYEVRLELADPDGGAATKLLIIRTKALPSLPVGGRTWHVKPGDGGGDGSRANPFQGLEFAQKSANPGDIFLLHTGNYGRFGVRRSGQPGRHIVWRAAGDGDVVFEAVRILASHVWFEGLTLRRGALPDGLTANRDSIGGVVNRCNFFGFDDAITMSQEGHGWFIADNVIVGVNNPEKGELRGEGINLTHSNDHTVCHNRISRTADGVSYTGRNCDVFGNDIFDVSDDGLEPDYGYANNRFWDNRITGAVHSGMSFQPMYCGPWYFIRNQVISRGYVFKFRVQDRFALINNTFVCWQPMDARMHHILTALSRNNLFISASGKDQVWLAHTGRNDPGSPYYIARDYKPDWRTDVDFDGFDWGDSQKAFRWDEGKPTYYPDIASFGAAVGIERHGMRVRKLEIFEKWNIPLEPGPTTPFNLTLRAGCNAIDAGEALPNLADNFTGLAPDLGAFEFGRVAVSHGPRN